MPMAANSEKKTMNDPTQATSASLREFRDTRWDVVLGILCLVLGFLGIHHAPRLQSFDGFYVGSSAGAGSIGSIEQIKGGVRHRVRRSILWHDLGDSHREVGEGDMLFTGENGGATLRMKDGNTAGVLPNSLVVVRSRLELERGSLNVTAGSERPLEVVANGTPVSIRSGAAKASVALVVDPNDAETPLRIQSDQSVVLALGAKDGVDAPARQIELKAGQTAVIHSDQRTSVETPRYRPLEPVSGAQVDVLEGGMVRFTWEKADAEPGPEHALFELADAGNRKVAIAGGQSSLELNLPSGNYRWRLTSARGDADVWSTGWQLFAVDAVEPPTAIEPVEGAKIRLAERSEQDVTFLWSGASARHGTSLSIVDGDGDERLVDVDPGRSSAVLELKPGTYRWRLRGVIDGSKRSAWGPWRELAILSDPLRDVDRLTASETAVVLPDSRLDRLPVRLRWDAVDGLDEYEVSVFDGDGEVVFKETVREAQADLMLTDLNGRHKFVVRALTSKGRSIASPNTKIGFELPTPSPARILSASPQSLYLTWSRVPLAAVYAVQVAKDSTFKTIIKEERRIDNYLLFELVDEPGQYFWRVRAEGGEYKSAWSAASSFMDERTK